jgi:hypothetical protein
MGNGAVKLAVAAILGLVAAGVRAEDLAERAAKSYAIDLSGSTRALAVGGRGAVVVVLRFQPGVHAQAQAPLRATLTASPGVALARDRLGWPDVVGPRSEAPRLEVPFAALAAGAQTVKVRLEFFACSNAWCVRQDREAVLSVAVAKP